MQGPRPLDSFDPVGFDNTGPADQPVTGLGSAESQHSLAKIRRQAYAVTVGTVSPETAGLTAPIRDAVGTAVAAVGVVTPVETLSSSVTGSPVRPPDAAGRRRTHRGSRDPLGRVTSRDHFVEKTSMANAHRPFCGTTRTMGAGIHVAMGEVRRGGKSVACIHNRQDGANRQDDTSGTQC
ncbi:IclR family transcriptional regulator domain-containing protein [Streptomyces sp. NPDC002596]